MKDKMRIENSEASELDSVHSLPVKIFATDINQEKQAESVVQSLEKEFPMLRFNIDLGDYQALPFPCGHSVLRAEGNTILVNKIISHVERTGFKCEHLEDKICQSTIQ